MRSEKDYKDLVRKYGYSLSVLKIVNEKLYYHLLTAEKFIDASGVRFAEMVRNLRIDFFSGNDSKKVDEPQAVVLNSGLYKESYAITYSPELGYMLGFLYIKESALHKKRVLCELYPNDITDLNGESVIEVLRILTLDDELKPKKVKQYFAGYTDSTMEIIMHDVDKPDVYQSVASIKLDELEEFQVDATDMF